MAMRYIVRRQNPSDLDQVRGFISDLDAKLGAPAADLRSEIGHTFSPSRRIVFNLNTQKEGEAFKWVCHTLELVAEGEEEFRKLTQQFQVNELPHLT